MKNSITPNYKRRFKGLETAKLQRAEKKAITSVRMQMATLEYATEMWGSVRTAVNELQDEIHAIEFELFRIDEVATKNGHGAITDSLVVPATKIQSFIALKKERDIWAEVVKEKGRNATSEKVFGKEKVYGSFNGEACRLLKTYTEPVAVKNYTTEFYCILLNEGEMNEKILTVGCNEVVVY